LPHTRTAPLSSCAARQSRSDLRTTNRRFPLPFRGCKPQNLQPGLKRGFASGGPGKTSPMSQEPAPTRHPIPALTRATLNRNQHPITLSAIAWSDGGSTTTVPPPTAGRLRHQRVCLHHWQSTLDRGPAVAWAMAGSRPLCQRHGDQHVRQPAANGSGVAAAHHCEDRVHRPSTPEAI